MLRACKYVAGIWLGALIAGYGVACGLLFVMTGQILVPQKQGARLLSPTQLVASIETWLDNVRMCDDESTL